MTDVQEGDVLRAEITGKTYRVNKVKGGKVHVSGLLPINKKEIESDIDAGKITVL